MTDMKSIRFLIFVFFAVATIAVATDGFAQRGNGKGKGGGNGGGNAGTVTLNKTGDMYFGIIGYETAHNGLISLGTNGAITVGGTGLAYNGNATAGSVVLSGNRNNVVDIKCSDTARVAIGNNRLDMRLLEISINSGTSFGAGQRCQGTKNNSPVTTTYDLAIGATPTIFMGGQLVVPTNALISGDYTSQNNQGAPMTLSIIYQ